MMKNTIVSTLQHPYSILVPTPVYAQELSKKKTDDKYVIKLSPSYDTITLQPGVNSVLHSDLERLQLARPFKGLVERGDIKVNDLSAEEAYRTKLDPHFRSNKDYLAAKKQTDLEAAISNLQKEHVELKGHNDELKEQIAVLLKQIKQGKVANDNPGDNKGKVP